MNRRVLLMLAVCMLMAIGFSGCIINGKCYLAWSGPSASYNWQQENLVEVVRNQSLPNNPPDIHMSWDDKSPHATAINYIGFGDDWFPTHAVNFSGKSSQVGFFGIEWEFHFDYDDDLDGRSTYVATINVEGNETPDWMGLESKFFDSFSIASGNDTDSTGAQTWASETINGLRKAEPEYSERELTTFRSWSMKDVVEYDRMPNFSGIERSVASDDRFDLRWQVAEIELRGAGWGEIDHDGNVYYAKWGDHSTRLSPTEEEMQAAIRDVFQRYDLPGPDFSEATYESRCS